SMRESLHKLTTVPHNLPEGTDSFLQELPVTKAQNSYTKIENGILVPLTGGPPVLQPTDKFFFKFFPISTEFTNKINCVLLEQAFSTSTIVFNKKKSACQAIEYYLTLDHGRGWKEVKGEDDPMLVYLKKLEEASALLGRKVVAKYQIDKGSLALGFSVLGETDQVFDLVNTDPGAKKIYNKLRYLFAEAPDQVESQPLDREDFEQAAKMLKLRIKIDTWTKGLNEQLREDTRNNLRDLYCERPAQQIWIYMKRIRFMKNGGTFLAPGNKIVDSNLSAELLPGPEDIIAHMAQLFEPPHHCRMIYYAAVNSVHMANPDFGLAKEFTLDGEGAKRLAQEKRLALGYQGSVCNCGIPHIEEAARNYRDAYQTNSPPDFASLGPLLQRILTKDEVIEIMTRLEVEKLFRESLRPELPNNPMGDLLDVLFQVVFPPFALARKQPECIQLREPKPEPESGCVVM
ncbi:hypothetical protein MMC12_004654, partial [Toensbergia leucococca]|nr:hypothetical protein [Toensbergia leucococca]